MKILAWIGVLVFLVLGLFLVTLAELESIPFRVRLAAICHLIAVFLLGWIARGEWP